MEIVHLMNMNSLNCKLRQRPLLSSTVSIHLFTDIRIWLLAEIEKQIEKSPKSDRFKNTTLSRSIRWMCSQLRKSMFWSYTCKISSIYSNKLSRQIPYIMCENYKFGRFYLCSSVQFFELPALLRCLVLVAIAQQRPLIGGEQKREMSDQLDSKFNKRLGMQDRHWLRHWVTSTYVSKKTAWGIPWITTQKSKWTCTSLRILCHANYWLPQLTFQSPVSQTSVGRVRLPVAMSNTTRKQ